MKITFGIVMILIIGVIYWYLNVSGIIETIFDHQNLKTYVLSLGSMGPLIIILLMTIAIVISPLPSAPIALISGAIFGHYWGTLYILVGAELGAIIAFTIARLLGFEILKKWIDTDALSQKFLGSQNILMAIVFASRLLPFVSFDLVSYAAGLSILTPLRFAIATLAGIIPASFLLAHFGKELSSFDPIRITISALILGGMTILPIIFKTVRSQMKKHNTKHN
jgi:uncharacterized membrane protein YdjX (TVP38/TMEM64 family)